MFKTKQFIYVPGEFVLAITVRIPVLFEANKISSDRMQDFEIFLLLGSNMGFLKGCVSKGGFPSIFPITWIWNLTQNNFINFPFLKVIRFVVSKIGS